MEIKVTIKCNHEKIELKIFSEDQHFQKKKKKLIDKNKS